MWWGSNIISSTTLASSGFFYTKYADACCCFACGLILKNWQKEHDPHMRHKFYSHSCLHIQFNEWTHLNLSHLKTCIICMERKCHYVHLPCGHCCTCHGCLLQIDKCPECHLPLAAIVRVYI